MPAASVRRLVSPTPCRANHSTTRPSSSSRGPGAVSGTGIRQGGGVERLGLHEISRKPVEHEAWGRIVKGEPVVILEAMKMENALVSPCDGIIQAVKYKSGDTVPQGATLCVI